METIPNYRRLAWVVLVPWLFLASSGISQIRSYELTATMTNNGSGLYTATGKTNNLTVPEGRQLECINYSHFFPMGGSGNINFSIQAQYEGSSKKLLEFYQSTSPTNAVGTVIIGPCSVDLVLAASWNYSGGGEPATPTVFIRFEESERKSISGGANLLAPSSSVVVPSNATGDVDVLLEQSTDMITWTQCLPGTYNASTQKRFFRVRAVEK